MPEEVQITNIEEVDGLAESDKRLMELGYKPEFRREMSLFGVLGISFCAIGILTGSSAAFQTGLFSGGPLGKISSVKTRRNVIETSASTTTRAVLGMECRNNRASFLSLLKECYDL